MRIRTSLAAGMAAVVASALSLTAPAAAIATPLCDGTNSTRARVCVKVIPQTLPTALAQFRSASHSPASQPPASAEAVSVAAAGWELDPDPSALPDFCNTPVTRVTACSAFQTIAAILDNRGTVKGTATVMVIYWGAVSNKALTWTMGAKAYVQTLTGAAATGSTINGTAVCSGACTVAGNGSTKLPLVVGAFMRGSWMITSNTPGATPVTSSQAVKLAFESPPPTVPGSGSTTALPTVRCDNSATIGRISPGCVYPAATPVFLLSGSAPPPSPQHAAFVASAQASLPGHPGRVDGTPLTRQANSAIVDSQRNISCAGFVKQYPDDSCDEYPFASTRQGGAGAAIAHIPQTDNTNGGNKLGAFIRENRVWDNDAYFVQVVA
ncbi:NucA/NucB deoxyribonuclease domain-containing protein [Couchioplanes azureus]|uniref:NucA/NucB deoxyribonuclease domain-containing protein n=1 Tax=Couchioplanes caeruleus TaxID=56438 RepID=UPI0016715F01|nr:NucA/NucB deoxyribonuclease domain-containing protein [Couchioplanes caeruleus]GGQ67161.1 hypothetical protein GCM10010166_41250 [Couchioplanes caeruleus subsp. azureus]